MIDYHKLKEAHELAQKLSISFCINVELGINHHSDASSRYLLCVNQGDEKEHFMGFDEIDELLEKLKELTGPKPKFKIGEYLYAEHAGEIIKFNVDEIDLDKVIGKFWYQGYQVGKSCALVRWDEPNVYTTKNELIDAQIKYWGVCGMMSESEYEKCQEEFNEDVINTLDEITDKLESMFKGKCSNSYEVGYFACYGNLLDLLYDAGLARK
jgi:hypothetical protein